MINVHENFLQKLRRPYFIIGSGVIISVCLLIEFENILWMSRGLSQCVQLYDGNSELVVRFPKEFENTSKNAIRISDDKTLPPLLSVRTSSYMNIESILDDNPEYKLREYDTFKGAIQEISTLNGKYIEYQQYVVVGDRMFHLYVNISTILSDNNKTAIAEKMLSSIRFHEADTSVDKPRVEDCSGWFKRK